ncbi:glycosyltransferase family 39 protein [Streptomyces sp. NPDC051665]|uniref:glycosyltransferase family 39 protein n=1 Tax=Streptomyces sp. NPDC051665 TaxID=3154647 RepID=UPI003449C75B
MLALGLWGLDRGGMWGDEGVTFLVGRRTVPQIWHLLHGVDAVHGLYYLLMHAVLAVHPGEVALRLPSVCGAAATAGLVAALGVRLARPRVGLWAGLLYAITPLTGHYAQEGRSYALVAAGVAWATLLLARALEERPGRARSWWPYGAVLAVTFLLHEFAVLVLCAHVLTLAAARAPRATWLGWARAVAVAGGALLPLAWVSQRQSAQVAWLRIPDWDTTERLARDFLAVTPTGIVFWTSLLLLLLGLGSNRLTSVALPLLLVPPLLLLTVSQFRPLFHERYVLYALAGAPLLVAAGADRVVGALRWLWLEGRGVPSGRRTEVERVVVGGGSRRELVGAVSGGGHRLGGDRRTGVGAGGGGGVGARDGVGVGAEVRAGAGWGGGTEPRGGAAVGVGAGAGGRAGAGADAQHRAAAAAAVGAQADAQDGAAAAVEALDGVDVRADVRDRAGGAGEAGVGGGARAATATATATGAGGGAVVGVRARAEAGAGARADVRDRAGGAGEAGAGGGTRAAAAATSRPSLTGVDRTTLLRPGTRRPPTAGPTLNRRPPRRTLLANRTPFTTLATRANLVTLAGVLAVTAPFLHGLPAYRSDRDAAHRPENLAAVSALAGRELRPGDPVLFLPSFWRVTASAYPGPFVGDRDLALGESGARSGTLSGREVGPGELRARLAGVDRVWIVAQSNLLPSRWVPGDPTDRVKLDVVDGEFARRQEYVRGRVKLALYIRRMPPQAMQSTQPVSTPRPRPASPNPTPP